MDPSSDFAEAVNPPESLVSYDTPIFIGTDSLHRSQAGSPTKKNIEGKLEEMLNAMLPPREWVEDSGVWAQHINTGNYNLCLLFNFSCGPYDLQFFTHH